MSIRVISSFFRRIVLGERVVLAVVIVGVCDRRLLSLVKLLILASRPSPSLAAVDINGV